MTICDTINVDILNRSRQASRSLAAATKSDHELAAKDSWSSTEPRALRWRDRYSENPCASRFVASIRRSNRRNCNAQLDAIQIDAVVQSRHPQ